MSLTHTRLRGMNRLMAMGLLLAQILPGFAVSNPAAPESPSVTAIPITFELDQPGRVSLAVFSADGVELIRTLLTGERMDAGRHVVTWDGLDRDGLPAPEGSHPWRLVTGPGLRATFLNALGTNPKNGPWSRWVGNHKGPSAIAIGKQGIVVGSPLAEGPPDIHFFERDFATTRWFAPHYGWRPNGSRALAMSDTAVVSLSQDARVKRFDLDSGAVLNDFDVLWDGDARPTGRDGRIMHMDAQSDQFAVTFLRHNAVRWYRCETGEMIREVGVAAPSRVSLRDDGGAWVLGDAGVLRVGVGGESQVMIHPSELTDPTAMDWDADTRSLLVANGAPDNRILRFSESGKLLQAYGVCGGRIPGPYHPDCFAEVADIAATGDGSFYVVEGGDVGGGLRRIAHVSESGRILSERFGGTPFFTVAAVVPGNPREVYYNLCPDFLGRYALDPKTGDSRLTHLLRNNNWGFPRFDSFPHYRPYVRNGQVYLVLRGRFVLKPDLERGELVPVALASNRPWGGWKTVPDPIRLAAAAQGIDPQSPAADAFTWSDANRNGRMDPGEFRFHPSSPGPGIAFLDGDMNIVFGQRNVPGHTYDEVNRRWIGFDFNASLYATLPNLAVNEDVPVWDLSRIVLSDAKMPDDPLGFWSHIVSRSIFKSPDGRVTVQALTNPSQSWDQHPDRWPTAQAAGTRLITASGNRIVAAVGKHASMGPPRDAQFGMPVHLLGRVGDLLIVCDRDAYTTAWTSDGLFVGQLLEQPVWGPQSEPSIDLSGDDWMSAGSIEDLGNGEALWFALAHDRSMVFRVAGFDKLERQSGAISLDRPPAHAKFDGQGLAANYFASPDLGGEPLASRIDPRLWFYDHSTPNKVVAAWAAAGPCEGIDAGKPFSAHWTGSVEAPYGEPFWFRVYNTRPGHGHTPTQQAWKDGRGLARVWLNSQLVIDKWHDSPPSNPWQTPALELEAGTRYDLKVAYAWPGEGDAQFSLVWCSETMDWSRIQTPFLHPEPAPRRPAVSVVAIEPVVREEASRPGIIRFSLAYPADRDLQIGFRLEGTAASSDYRVEGSPLVIPAGGTHADLTILPLDDRQTEANETVVVTMLPGVAYTGDGTAGSASVTLVDDENVLVDPSLVVYYTFDNADLTVRENFASIRNEAGADHALKVASYRLALPRRVAGLARHGEALGFPDGKNTRTVSGGSINLVDFTVAFWFKAGQPASGICEAAGVSFQMAGGRLLANFAGWMCEPVGTALDDGQWHHIALTWTQASRKMTLYLDGKNMESRIGPGNGRLSGTFSLGRSNAAGPFSGGAIDEFRVYARPLDDADILRLRGATDK